MPFCCVPHCMNHSRNGWRLFCFPRDPGRRRLWSAMVQRENWQPTKASRVCSAHFEECNFEQHRADGVKKLKPNAFPTLFLSRSEHAAQKFRTMKTKYKDLRRARELAGVAAMGRPRWRYYDLMDDFMGTRERETGSGSADPVMVISNIFSVAEASASGADPEREAAIVPEVLPDERAADDGPPRKKIKPEPREEDEDEDESRDTQRTNESGGGDEQLLLDGDSLGSNHQLPPERPPERLHRAAMDNGAASTSASAGTLDAFHFFGMMIADRLRLLPRGTALRALNAMHQVLFEHETGSQR
ncbi:hypothetical protein V5799_011008 [Amblyomma americanum]|uniref:THAP-type domain-containing protein n=1 Tax=Amblyomma americanum TaxID=6943 RepID=A0AAQ4EI45_AMBAM